MRPLALVLTLIIAFPALAQEAPEFTARDAELMTACIDDIKAQYAAAAGPAPQRPLTECIGAASDICMDTEDGGSTTIGISACLGRETAWWDSQLNVHYASLEQTLDPDVFSSLRTAQRAWIGYRDAACAFAYDLWRGGSIRSTVHASCMLDETARRAAALARYADGTP